MNAPVEILETPWRKKFLEYVREAKSEIIICAPYFSEDVISQILDTRRISVKLKFLLGFTKESLEGGQSEPKALIRIIKSKPNVESKQIENLHAKVYIFDGRKAIVTSSNPTSRGLQRNVEFGVCLEGEEATTLRERVMAYWTDPGAEVLNSTWLLKHKSLLDKAAKSSKYKIKSEEIRIGNWIPPKGIEMDGNWAFLWSTHAGEHIEKHIKQIKEQGATLWGADFGIKLKWFTFPLIGYLYVTLNRVSYRAVIADIETYKEACKPKEVSLRPPEYKNEYHKTYLKLTELKLIETPIKVEQFRKHDGTQVSKYGLQGYVRVIPPSLDN